MLTMGCTQTVYSKEATVYNLSVSILTIALFCDAELK
ncbi:hypothetical protein SAMN06265350_10851 [Solitalea koreensis]|uniref:Uncharacterized protein n=1 Tax=Solitalea koreensis TaxID=543615 RepID=A0A521DRI6_9SPHI|nr:hypothetical protein SAMN06265350_10851 [Solitalea koreensis]